MRLLSRVFLVVAVVLFFSVALLWVPEWMANQYRLQNAREWAEQVTANRAMLVNLLGGIAVATTIYFTYANFKVAQDKQTTDVFSRAIEQLGNANMSVRLGGIHSLARIAKNSQSEYFPVMEVFTGFLRDRYRGPLVGAATSSRPPNCPVEVQAILTIIGDRYWSDPVGDKMDLSEIHIAEAWVPKADFRNTYFWSTKLTKWNFTEAKLIGADFKEATLDRCDFTGADLTNANLEDTRILEPIGLVKQQLDAANNADPALYELIGH